MNELLEKMESLPEKKRRLLELMYSGRLRMKKTYPLSYSQQRLWFLQQLDPGSAAYNMAFALRLAGSLDHGILRKSFDEIVRRHEVLRTSFTEKDSKLVQEIVPELQLNIEEIDLTALPAPDQRVLEIAATEANAPFDLSRAPLLRAKLLHVREREYVLLITMHHIISDGWSTAVLVREFSALYTAYLSGTSSPLPDLQIQYGDYAVWQRDWLQGETLERPLAYWRQALAAVPVLELPTDHPRVPARTGKGEKILFEFSPEISGKLHQLSRREGATLFMLLLAGWQLVLSRHSRQKDIAVGTPVAGRGRQETENLIGFFVNTLVLRTDLDGNPTVSGFLKRVKQVALNAFEHQDLPFEKLVENLQPDRTEGHTPLFQVMLSLQNTRQEQLQLPGLQLSEFVTGAHTAKFDLDLAFSESASGLSGKLSYANDLFAQETANALVNHLRLVLEQMVADPEMRINQITLLSEEERGQTLTEWNRTVASYSQKCVHELIEEQVLRTPEAVAVVFQNQQLTYAELNRRANQLAHSLRNMGVGPEARVGICMERSFEMVIGLLGILKAGGMYVPLDPGYPFERLRYMVADAKMDLILVEEKWKGLVEESDARLLDLHKWEEIGSQSCENPGVGLTPEHAIYMIYTSGSTGRPKGAVNTHAGLCNRLTWMQEAYGLTPDDAVLQKTPFSFDVSVWEFFWPLLAGARLVMAEPGGHRDSSYLAKLIQQEKITTLHFVPSMLSIFLQDPEACNCAGLRLVISSGEALPKAVVERFKEHLPWAALHNLYGPTEASVDVTYWDCRKSETKMVVPIGRPIANTAIYILDEEGEPVPAGIAGELHIGGIGLARGYWKRAELTAEKFVPHAFGQVPGERLYRTGDLARWSRQGEIEYLGRLDHQVKLRGFRIELGEIESVLGQYPGVNECVVVVRGECEEKRLVAYIAAEHSAEFNKDPLTAYMKERLAEYMVPKTIVVLKELPLTPNGKVDRRALPQPETQTAAAAEDYLPRNAVEEILCGIWAEVLKRDRLAVNENFFDLGGHSLLATQAVSRIRKALNVELPLRLFIEAGTVRGLAEKIGGIARCETSLPPLEQVKRTAGSEMPLSYAQQRLWFLQQLEPWSAAYNIAFGVRMYGDLHRQALHSSLTQIIDRHEVLHTVFPAHDGKPVQKVTAVALEIRETDLSGLPAEDRESQAEELARHDAGQPFDLANGPLLRLRLVRMAEQEHLLIVCMHHIVSDGWSSGIMLDEFTKIYEAHAQSVKPDLPELEFQYGDFAIWQRKWLQGEILEKQLAYWRKQLAGSQPLKLPADHKIVTGTRGRGSFNFELGSELTSRLKQMSQREGVTLFMGLLAVFKLVMGAYAGQDDVVIGTDIANRNYREIEGLIGFFVNQLVLRTNLGGNPGFRELLWRVRDMSFEAFRYQDAPFEKVVEDLAPGPDQDGLPLFRIKLVLQNTPASGQTIAGLQSKLVMIAPEIAKFDLMLTCTETPTGLSGVIEYRKDLFHQGTIGLLAAQVRQVADVVTGNPQISVREIQEMLQTSTKVHHQAREKTIKQTAAQMLASVRRHRISLSDLN